MKESISGTTLFMIVIFFIIVFTGYLCFSINQSRAFSVKNGIIRIVERYGIGIKSPDGVKKLEQNSNFTTAIENELKDIGYRTTGKCNSSGDTDWYAFNVKGKYENSGVGAFCIKFIGNASVSNQNPAKNLHYFSIKTFYHFDIPGVSRLLNMTIEGNTKSMQ